MKKSEFTQLTQIIEHIVAKEIRKQLPTLIAETFQNMMGKQQVVAEHRVAQPVKQRVVEQPVDDELDDQINLKQSLREMFAGTSVMEPAKREPKKFSKNPILNEILNNTAPISSRERMMGMAAPSGGYASAFAPMATPAMLDDGSDTGNEPSFMKNVPMPNIGQNHAPIQPRSQPRLVEGQESTHAPMDEIPEGISVLDVARQVPMDKAVTRALTRDYSQMMKLIDKKRR